MKRSMSLVLGCIIAASLLAPVSAQSAAKCAEAKHPGGEWRSFGNDLQNSRWQSAKEVPAAADLTTRLPKWKLSIAAAGAAGNFQSTPVVADGCIYAGTNAGWIIAANADTGEVVWTQNVPASDLLAGLSGGVFSLTVEGGKVFALVSAAGAPTAVALDQDTGKVVWKNTVSKEDGAYTNASPVVIGDYLFMGISGPEDITKGRHPGGYAILDKDSGELVSREYTIDKKDSARGQWGASLWGTAVFDPKTGYVYDGTGQPANKDREHSRSNAVVKIDFNKGAGFGQIVDSYHGDYDNRADVDFGASPTMFKNKKGDTIIATLQKSGKLHAVYGDTMEQAWWIQLSDPLILGNTSSGATDGKALYIAGNTQTAVPAGLNDAVFAPKEPNPGYLYSINVENGTVNWKTPIAGGVEYHLISGAGDVVYVVTTHGLVLGLDRANGLPVFVRSLTTDAADACVNLSSGAIVARNTIYAVCDVGAAGGGWIVAY